MTSQQRGPIETATDDLAAWLERVSGVAVRVGPPVDGDQAGLSLWPFELRPEHQTRGSGAPHPYRFVVRYVVTGSGAAALGLLDRILTEAVRVGEPALRLDGIDHRVWSSVRATPRPVLVFEVPAQIAHPLPDAPLVRQPLIVKHVDMRPVTGQVRGPGGQAVAGLRVEVAGTGLATYTDAGGRFTFDGVPATGRLPLRLLGRGRTFTAEVSLAEPGPVVITCEFIDDPE
jgi:hypothetical protein